MNTLLCSLILFTSLFSQSVSFSSVEMQKYVVQGFYEENIIVNCEISPSKNEGSFDYHIEHIKGFSNSQDFLFASMGTVAMNSVMADFDSEWLYMTYDDSTWKIKIKILQNSFSKVMNAENEEEDLEIVDFLIDSLEEIH